MLVLLKDTLQRTFYEGCLSDELKVGNGVRQGGDTSGMRFKLYLSEVLTDIPNLPLGCNSVATE